jgi:arsenic resistance protein ArsH
MTENRLANGIKAAQLLNGDLNNTAAARVRVHIEGDEFYTGRSFAIPPTEDDLIVRRDYRPFLLDAAVESSDWIAWLELNSALQMVDTEIISKGKERLKVLVMYGSLRERLVEVQDRV